MPAGRVQERKERRAGREETEMIGAGLAGREGEGRLPLGPAWLPPCGETSEDWQSGPQSPVDTTPTPTPPALPLLGGEFQSHQVSCHISAALTVLSEFPLDVGKALS